MYDLTEHERQVLRLIYGRGLAFSVDPERYSESVRKLMAAGLIERGRDDDPASGSEVHRLTDWGRSVLGVEDQAIQ